MSTGPPTLDPIWEDSNRWVRGPLPQSLNCDGRPIYEPPIFAYADITDEYEKRRLTVLKYADGDVVKTTEIMDELIAVDLTDRYVTWIGDNLDQDARKGNEKGRNWWRTLWDEVHEDWLEDAHKWRNLRLEKDGDGEWEIKFYNVVGGGGVGFEACEDSCCNSCDEEDNRDSAESKEEECPSTLPQSARAKTLPSSLSVQSPGMVQILERSKTWYGTPLALRILRLCNIETGNEEGGKESTTEDELD